MRLLIIVLLILQIPIVWGLYHETAVFEKSLFGKKLEDAYNDPESHLYDTGIVCAAARFEQYAHRLEGKKLGLVVNHTSLVGETHLVDTLLKQGFEIRRIFAPEHGFRGTADAGEKVANSIDASTRIPIVSVYGEHKRPQAAQLEGVDLIIFDIQDVGVRAYTYTSTMTYMMEACAAAKIPFLVLDRPNPLGFYVDGAILEPAQKSFVGLHPVPFVHGLTTAEYARMINEEGWLKNGQRCDLYYVPCEGYTHSKFYKLPVRPSPNLVDMRSVYLYPSLCFFEGTDISLGRGTDTPFQMYGHPSFDAKKAPYQFKPQPKTGAKSPPHLDKNCYGWSLTGLKIETLQQTRTLGLEYLLNAYRNFGNKPNFFLKTNFFELLAGNTELRKQIEKGFTEAEIRKTWAKDLEKYHQLRQKYLLYEN
jgi:uncharacterized protein YbbC (DUF1343 family)